MGKLGRKAHVKKVQRIYEKLEKAKTSAIKKVIADLKGKRFTGKFICDMCRHNSMIGYLYATENTEYEICKFCHDSIFDIGHHTKVLYTPMGNKR